VVWNNKPINGEEFQMYSWQSDQPIVVMKQGNACGAKGLTVLPLDSGTLSPDSELDSGREQNDYPQLIG
jgi:hypothetical protein